MTTSYRNRRQSAAPHGTKVSACEPRKNELLLTGSKGDRIDAHQLAQLVRAGVVTPVSQEEHGTRTRTELARSTECLVRDWVMLSW